MGDETRDISNHEQLSIIRSVDLNYDIHEDLIGTVGTVHVPDTTSATLTIVLKDFLVRCVLPLESCRGKAYDGAANMIGRLSGVAQQIQSEQPEAIKVHCLAHSPNLCLQDTAKNANQLGMPLIT